MTHIDELCNTDVLVDSFDSISLNPFAMNHYAACVKLLVRLLFLAIATGVDASNDSSGNIP
jgi:hypothetical protein